MHFNTGCGSIWYNYDFVDENVRGMVRERERDQRRRQTDATPKSRSLRACVRVLLSVRVQIAPRRKWEASDARATVSLVMCPLVALDLHVIMDSGV